MKDLGLILPAAGVGSRMKARLHKPFLPLDGRPILFHTLARFRAIPAFRARVLVLHRDDLAWVEKRWGRRLRELGVTALVEGGTRRQDSVESGLRAMPPQVRVVLVHDVVRPFVTEGVIRAVARGARRTGAALAAVPATDTVKEVEGALVARTLPRERVWLAQTPQGFRRDLLETAFERSRALPDPATDECVLFERLGFPVEVVEGSRSNIKITVPEDVAAARLYLRAWHDRPLD